MHCEKCGLAGHNSKKCPNTGAVHKWPPKKKKSVTRHTIEHESESMNLDIDEGPSQPTQNSMNE